MVYQTGRQVAVAYKAESSYGTLAGATSGKVFRPNSGNISLTKDPIKSNENRRDGMMTRSRHGSRAVAGSYAGDLSVGSYDDFIEAVMRGTFDAALVITEATGSLTSITTGVNSIVNGGGSWITAGLAVGDVIRLTGHSSSGNNSRNLRITAITDSTITVAETLTVNAVADTAFTITRPKKVIQGTTARSFTVEEQEVEIDSSEVFTGVRVGQMQLSMQPNGMAIVTFSLAGQDMQIMSGGSSPYFTSPTTTTTIGLTAVEAKIRLGATDVLDVSSLDLTINLNAAGNPVVGSVLTPDVFTNLADVTGTITALKQDVTRSQAFLDETQLSLHLLFEENESGAKDFCSFYLGNLTLASATKSDLGADGARTQQLALMIGIDQAGAGHAETMISFQTSSA